MYCTNGKPVLSLNSARSRWTERLTERASSSGEWAWAMSLCIVLMTFINRRSDEAPAWALLSRTVSATRVVGFGKLNMALPSVVLSGKELRFRAQRHTAESRAAVAREATMNEFLRSVTAGSLKL